MMTKSTVNVMNTLEEKEEKMLVWAELKVSTTTLVRNQ
jgi:hypothetical protein